MKAWVVTVEAYRKGRFATRVVGIVSARRSSVFMEQYLEALHAMLELDLGEQRDDARYNGESRFAILKDSDYSIVLNGAAIALHAQRSEISAIEVEGDRTFLTWQGLPYTRRDRSRFQPKRQRVEQGKLSLDDGLPDRRRREG